MKFKVINVYFVMETPHFTGSINNIAVQIRIQYPIILHNQIFVSIKINRCHDNVFIC